MEQLRGRVAVVTGSASGIGRGMAERFAREGMTVVIADNRLPAAEEVAAGIEAEGGKAVPIQVDVSQRDSVSALADRVDAELGGAALLVNNAGVLSFSPVREPEERGWRWIVDVNLFGVVYGLQAFVPRMLASGNEGHVVNVASLAGVVGGGASERNRIRRGDGKPESFNAMYGYMATKHAVVAVSESLARELSGTPIGVSVLCPSHHEDSGIFANSARHRPEEFGGPMTEREVELMTGRTERDRDDTYGQRVRYPLVSECAARVLRAVREGHFYIFTHPETRVAIEKRYAEMLAAFDDTDSFSG